MKRKNLDLLKYVTRNNNGIINGFVENEFIKKIVKKELKVTSELDDWDDIKPLDITDEDLKF